MTTQNEEALAELERAHAERYYGKYSSGYNRGYARGREERWALVQENYALRQFLRELAELNAQCDGDILPSDYAERIPKLLGE